MVVPWAVRQIRSQPGASAALGFEQLLPLAFMGPVLGVLVRLLSPSTYDEVREVLWAVQSITMVMVGSMPAALTGALQGASHTLFRLATLSMITDIFMFQVRSEFVAGPCLLRTRCCVGAAPADVAGCNGGAQA